MRVLLYVAVALFMLGVVGVQTTTAHDRLFPNRDKFTGGAVSSDLDLDGNALFIDADGDSRIQENTDDIISIYTAGAEGLRIQNTRIEIRGGRELYIGAGRTTLTEIADPGNAAANNARLYARDNGSGRTQLVVVFSSGVEQVLATEP